jgi:hypothetical protein
MARRPKPVHQMTAAQFDAAFPNEDACKRYLVARRWGECGTRCPRCWSGKVSAVKTMPYKWQCYSCAPDGYRFSHISGTIFENTNKPLRDWFRVTHLMLTSKKGMSALQIHRFMGFGSYKTAWYMCHRIRAGLVEPQTQLGGIVEVDETWIGGKDGNVTGTRKSAVPVAQARQNSGLSARSAAREALLLASSLASPRKPLRASFARSCPTR